MGVVWKTTQSKGVDTMKSSKHNASFRATVGVVLGKFIHIREKETIREVNIYRV